MQNGFQEKLLRAALFCDPVTRLPFQAAYSVLHAVTVLQAKKDPLWVQYMASSDKESRTQNTDGTGGGHGTMGFAEFQERIQASGKAHKIEDSLAFFPRTEGWLGRACYVGWASIPVKETIWALQRVSRGWDDRSLWSLDSSASRQLGEQLLALADVSHGWPGEQSEFSTHNDWVTALTKHGNALVAYANFDYPASISDEEIDEFEYTAENLKKEHNTQAAITKRAAAAFRWVAKNLESLWD